MDRSITITVVVLWVARCSMMREGCSADAVLGERTSNNMDVEELPYRCSSDSGRAMGNRRGSNNVVDVG